MGGIHNKLKKMIKQNSDVFAMSLEALIAMALILGAVRLVIGAEGARALVTKLTGAWSGQDGAGGVKGFMAKQLAKLTGLGRDALKKMAPEQSALRNFLNRVGSAAGSAQAAASKGLGALNERGLGGLGVDAARAGGRKYSAWRAGAGRGKVDQGSLDPSEWEFDLS